MKRIAVSLIICIVVCAVQPRQANAVPNLNLWLTGSFNSGTSTIDLQVRRTNTEFNLGSLSYNLQFSEDLTLTREYSNFGWVANDGLFDLSSPVDAGAAGSAIDTFNNIRFDTVHSPIGDEFPPGTNFVVETIKIYLEDLTPRWINFDFDGPEAADGDGTNLVTGLGGSINAEGTSVHIPEPVSISLLGLGGLLLIKRRYR